MNNDLRINYFGMFRSTASWARVNRELALGLHRAGCHVSGTNCKGFLHDPSFALAPRLRELIDRPRNTDIEVAFEYPLNYRKLLGRLKIGLLVYETCPLPTRWADAISSDIDHLVVPSEFCHRIMLDSGIPRDRVSVAPYGVDTSIFQPRRGDRQLLEPYARVPDESGHRRKPFTFLCVATPHLRKGIVELIEAYGRAFTSKDNVLLRLKSTYEPGRYGHPRPWETPPLTELVRQARGRAACFPPVDVAVEQVPEEQLAALYAACDCYVQPSYSEGFGLSILEAIACGKPVITTGWGGQMDFCDESNSYLIDYTLAPAGAAQYDNRSPEAVAAHPSVEHLAEMMRRVFDHRDDAEAKGAKALETARRFTWDHAAARLIEIIRQQLTVSH